MILLILHRTFASPLGSDRRVPQGLRALTLSWPRIVPGAPAWAQAQMPGEGTQPMPKIRCRFELLTDSGPSVRLAASISPLACHWPEGYPAEYGPRVWGTPRLAMFECRGILEAAILTYLVVV